MTLAAQSSGRRERNKRDKLERITTAARELFEERGVDDVTTQQVADKADIGTGTLFLYAKTKGELLLLVQNSDYDTALDRGIAAAANEKRPVDAVMAILQPIVECNRSRVDNGRVYLRELMFGDAEEPHHREALALTQRTEEAVIEVLSRESATPPRHALVRARAISSIMFVTLSAPFNVALTTEQLLDELSEQIRLLTD